MRKQYTPATECFKEIRMMLNAYCKDMYVIASTLMVMRELYKSIIRVPDGNRPEDLRLFHSLICKNNVILDYYGVW